MHGDAGGANAAFHGALPAKHLAHYGPRAGTHAAFGGAAAAGGLAGGVASGGVGAHRHIAQHHIKQHGSGHQWNTAHANGQARTLLFQPAHGAGSAVQPPGAAARQHDAVHLLHQIAGVQQIGLARAGGCAAHIHTAHRTFGAQHHAAAGGAACVGAMAHVNSLHLGDVAGVGEQWLMHG